jgi:hypothetical protein
LSGSTSWLFIFKARNQPAKSHKGGKRMQTKKAHDLSEDSFKKPESFKPPVAWLLGPQLIASLKSIAIYIAFKGKLDLRDWMRPEVSDLSSTARFNAEVGQDEFWFDYFSDTGDGQTAMYTIAYLCLSKLWTEDSPKAGSKASFEQEASCTRMLPRGELLFVGGDTSYHIADYASLASRFQSPFHWAFNDLKAKGKISDGEPRRPIFGIPGNHDYYDMIDGFHRQFCKPSSDEDSLTETGLKPQLSIPGFRRCQMASYVALKLPFDWWLWGLDNEVGRLDIKQQEFFKEIYKDHPPDKLIVATPEPTTVLGRRAQSDDKPVKAFEDLDLDSPFLERGKLAEEKCRLDLSGDTHHYARYWGPASHGNSERADNYASVVAGMGGAFLHPSHANFEEVKPQALYPPPDTSRLKVAAEIFNPLNIIRGGYIFALGMLMSLVVYFAATVPLSSKRVVDRLLQKLFGVAPYHEGWLTSLFPPLEFPPQGFLQSAGLSWPAIALRGGLLILSTALIILSVSHLKWIVDLSRKEEYKSRSYKIRTIALVAAGLVCLLLGSWDFVRRREYLPPFASSVMVLFAIVWAGSAVAASVIYSEWLFKWAARYAVSKKDYWPVWLLNALAVAILCAGVFLFGRYPFAYLFSDLVFASLVGGALVSLTLLAALVGGGPRGAWGKVGFGALGFWHALLQLAVPFLLVRFGSPWAWIAAPVLVGIFIVVGNKAVKKDMRVVLLLAWLVYGVLLLWLPFLLPATPEQYATTGWRASRFLVVLVLGALMSCVWVGWYFAVSLAFKGHNNEAGGAARIEGFKQFIRIRLTRDCLTAYVIGVDDPKTDATDLKLKLIDKFELRVKNHVNQT